jgi:hypothetical protein
MNSHRGTIRIDRIIGLTRDNSVFAQATDTRTGKSCLWIVDAGSEKLFKYMPAENRWRKTGTRATNAALQHICKAIAEGVPVYSIDTDFTGVAGRN